MLVTRPVLVEACTGPLFTPLVCGRFLHVVLCWEKLPLTMSSVSYGTLLSVILTYNSKTTSSILTKFFEGKRSSMGNMLAKFRFLEIVAMETVTNSLLLFFE